MKVRKSERQRQQASSENERERERESRRGVQPHAADQRLPVQSGVMNQSIIAWSYCATEGTDTFAGQRPSAAGLAHDACLHNKPATTFTSPQETNDSWISPHLPSLVFFATTHREGTDIGIDSTCSSSRSSSSSSSDNRSISPLANRQSPSTAIVDADANRTISRVT